MDKVGAQNMPFPAELIFFIGNVKLDWFAVREEGISQLGIENFTYPYKPWYIYCSMGIYLKLQGNLQFCFLIQ